MCARSKRRRERLRALDYQYGGGSCRDAVVAQLSWGQQMLGASSTDVVRKRLYVALADLHNLAGWTSFDTGLMDSARNHFGQALDLAKQGENEALMANILYRMGRVYLHQNAPDDALKVFQLGQLAAQNSGSELAVGILCANEAWAYAKMGSDDAGAQAARPCARRVLPRERRRSPRLGQVLQRDRPLVHDRHGAHGAGADGGREVHEDRDPGAVQGHQQLR